VREQVKRVSGVSLGRTGSGGNPSSAAMELQRKDTLTLGSLDRFPNALYFIFETKIC